MKKYLLLLLLAVVGCTNTIIAKDGIYGDTDITELSNPVSDNKNVAHPYFDDKGTLNWFRQDKLKEALATGKRVVMEVGRRQCSLCQFFVEDTLPKFGMKDYVGVEVDVDRMLPDIKKLVMNMKHAYILPIIMIIDKNGKFVDGLFGKVTEKDFKAFLIKNKA